MADPQTDKVLKVMPIFAVCISAVLISFIAFDYVSEKYVAPSSNLCNQIIDFMGEPEHAKFHSDYVELMNELHGIMEKCHEMKVFGDDDSNKMIGMEMSP